MRATGPVVLVVLTTLSCSQPGATPTMSPHAPSPTAAATAGEVLVIDQSELDEIRNRYDISQPLDEVSAIVTCESGRASAECERAARQQLREAAVSRGANLAAIVSTALAQSHPPRLSLKATLYRATPR